jgi:hypothetical protein
LKNLKFREKLKAWRTFGWTVYVELFKSLIYYEKEMFCIFMILGSTYQQKPKVEIINRSHRESSGIGGA